MKTREELNKKVAETKAAYDTAIHNLYKFDAKAENNVFATLDEAESEVEDKLLNEASDDCAGAGNMGCEAYTQEFMVDNVAYIGTLTVEYNRHDKTYYYVDGSNFTYKLLGE